MPDLGLSAITRNPFPDWPHLHCCAPNHSILQSSILLCNVKLKKSFLQRGGCHLFTALSHAKPYRLNVSVHWCILIEISAIWSASIFCIWQIAMLLESVVLLYGVFSSANKNFQFYHLFFSSWFYQFYQILLCQWASRTFSFEGSAPYIMRNTVAWKKPSF